MSFQENIKQWVLIDNEIKTLTDKVKELRQIRNNKLEPILQHVETNNLSNATVQISDGRLKFTPIRQTTPLTFTFIETCLNQCIGNEEQVKQIITFIKESREVKYIPDIKRTYVN
tara:strand:- start:836 stop:1180 length:345 start_codon:yes stop_codon:yes gene_type:complete